ncbi:MAG: hypothetical protein ACYC33_06165 [Thermoleophilia bacterium]
MTTHDWKEYIASIDKATRELAAGRTRGDLALEAAHLAVRNPDGRVVDQYFGIPEYSVSAWSGGNDLMLLQQNRLALLPSIQAKATEFGIEVVSSSLELEDGIQTLNVRARISADIDGKLLEGFVEQMWGMLFARNEDGAQIGVGFFLADGSDGKRLVTEVHDFLIGFRMVHADIAYPPTD